MRMRKKRWVQGQKEVEQQQKFQFETESDQRKSQTSQLQNVVLLTHSAADFSIASVVSPWKRERETEKCVGCFWDNFFPHFFVSQREYWLNKQRQPQQKAYMFGL